MKRLLLRLYPARWRERYGDELLALVDEAGFGPRAALDMARGGMRERVHALRRAIVQGGAEMVIGPAWRHPTGWALVAALVLAPTLLLVGMSYLTYELGLSGLAAMMEPVNDAINRVRPLDLLLVAAPLIALLVALVPLLRLELRRGAEVGTTEAVVGLRLRAANLLVGLAALAVGGLLLGHIVVESVLQIGP